MVITSILSLAALVSSVCQVSATRFCQCENPTHHRVFAGINGICSQLSDDWCSTNCNAVNLNCDYCQFKPAGSGNDADFASLTSWCHKQEGYDSGSSTPYHGTDVFCYSYKNRAPKGFLQGGCAHENNGDNPLPPGEVRDTTVKFEYPFQGEWVKRDCSNLKHKDGPLLVNGFVKNNAQCKIEGPGTTKPVLNCPYYESSAARTKMRDAFKSDCAYYGGQWHSYRNGPAVAEAVGGIAAEELLSNSDQHPIRISLSIEEEDGADLEKITGGKRDDVEEDIDLGIKHEM